MKTKKLRIIVSILMLFQNFTFPSAILAEKMEQRLSEESPVNLSESSPPEKASSEQFSEKLPSLEESISESTSTSTSESSVENITNTQELIEIPKEITVQASENMKSRLITEQLRQILYSDGEQSYIVKTLQPSISQRVTLGNTVGSTQKFTVTAPAASTSNGNGNDWISLIASDTEEHDSRYRWMQYGDFRGEPHKYALTNVWIDSMPEGIELMEVTTPSVNNSMVSFTVTIKRTMDTVDTRDSFSLTGDIRLGTTATTGAPGGEPIKNIEDVKYFNATLGRITVVLEDNRKITAEASASTVVLGTNIKEISYEDFVKNVKLGSEVLTKDKYTTELVGEYSTDFFGNKIAKVRIALKANPTKITEVNVPVQVLWGNSIAYGGLGYGSDRTTAVFSLHQGSKPKITISQGQGNDNHPIHYLFTGEKYYSFDWFNLKSATDIHMTSDKKGDQSIEAEGQEKKQDALKKWQTQEVSHGDVVRSWVAEGKNHLYVNENREFNGNEAYYEITKNGYQLLNFNKLKITKQSVYYQATKEEMDKAVQSYIDTSGHQNIKAIKFIKYPDTSSLKDTEGTIRIAETLASGKTVTYDYTVPFAITRKITAEAATPSINLGTNIKEIAYEDFVKNVKLGDEVLTKDKYTVELVGEYATDYLGEKTAKVRVTLKATPTNTIEVDVPVQVLWGSSIAYGGLGYGSDRTTAVFSLHQGSKPKITISQGQGNDNHPIHYLFTGEKYYSFDWFNLKSATDIHMTSDKKGDQSIEAEGQEKKQDALKKWQTQEVSHGDVVRSWVAEGKNHLYVNENREFNGNEAYYEITKNGYQLLNFNKLKITKQSVYYQATKEEMDKAVQSYIDTSGHQNIKAVKFVKYPDTSNLNDTEGVIRIAETLTSGKIVTHDYMVPFSVVKDNSWIKVKVPTKILFAQISKESSILSPEYEIVNLSERGIKVSINSVIKGTSSELIPELNLHSTNLTNGHKITLVTPDDSNNFPQELGVMTKKNDSIKFNLNGDVGAYSDYSTVIRPEYRLQLRFEPNN